MFMKKAQAAMEFLMTYGWAILIVLAVIATLTSFGVLNTDIFIPSKCILGTAGMMNCVDFTVAKDTSDNVRVFFVIEGSSIPDNVKVNSFYLTGGDIGEGVNCGGAVNTHFSYTDLKKLDESFTQLKTDSSTTPATKYMSFPRNSKQMFYVGAWSAATVTTATTLDKALLFADTTSDCSGLADIPEGKKLKASLVMEYKVGGSPEPKKFRGELVAPMEVGAFTIPTT